MKKNTAHLQVARQRGRTLLELMISITIGLVVIGAISVVYLTSTVTSRQSLATSRTSEDAAIAMTILGNHLRMAGYSPPRTLVPTGSALVGGGKVAIPDRNLTGYAIRGCDFGFSSAVTTSTTFENLTCSTTAGPAAFAVRYEADVFNTFPVNKNSPKPEGDPSDCVSAGISANTISSYDAAAQYSLSEARFSVATSASNGTPELYCAGSGGTTKRFNKQPLMQFVENMVLNYGIADDNISGNVVRYVTQTELDALTGTIESHWSRVVNVKLCIIMRSDKPHPNGGGNYINCTGNSVASDGGYIRRAFTSVFTLRNRADFSDAL